MLIQRKSLGDWTGVITLQVVSEKIEFEGVVMNQDSFSEIADPTHLQTNERITKIFKMAC